MSTDHWNHVEIFMLYNSLNGVSFPYNVSRFDLKQGLHCLYLLTIGRNKR